ncbi:hypothetical protein GL218_02222 [Daldinia childiae]|uniref:uncharacterized protein n=1 Tax=Daldinia childiae TaxID=326645 RepID=UPI0014461C5C|nr:uncharacterized protein GL218_02222 [Daldinia childiae]KAF3064295.1 hypothetical protein GL218_02222 [Daldinia childiae]
MLAARDQENLAFSHQNGAALKQQQGQAKRQLQPKTPGTRYANTPIKVPLNDENGAGGAKSILGGRSRGNENTLTTKGGKSVNKSNLATPSGPRSRAPLGDKTTNAKAKGSQAITVKSAVRELEKSQGKAPGTIRPKQKQPQAELQKLVVHAEGADLLSEEEIEYCPPKPKDSLTKNLFKGYYDHYFNPLDENGVSLADRELEERNRKAMEECDRRIQEDIDSIEWGIQEEPETTKKATFVPTRAPLGVKRTAMNRVPSTIQAKKAARALSIDDTTKSLQRKAVRPMEVSRIPAKKTTSLPIPSFRRQPGTQTQALPRKTSTEIEANSRTTIGYNKGRTTAAILAQGTTKPERPASKTGFARTNTTLSNESDRTITPARYAHTQAIVAAEDQEWKERVPFLSIFNPEEDDDDDDFDLLTGSTLKGPCVDEDEDFEFKLAD